jgi:hypothetical protein
MLQQFLIPQLGEDDQKERILFQQDGTPHNYLREVREYFTTRFQGPWIGRVAPITWPPRFPDLTRLIFFFSFGDSLNITI